MVQTTRLQLPLIAAAQAQKHVTHNEAVLRLDGLCQMQAVSYTVSTQPGSPADGDLYLLPAGKTGTAWGGAANHAVAHYYDGVWHFYAPRPGWIAFVADTSRLVYHNGTQWTDLLTPSGASAADGSASAPGFAFASDTNTGIYRIGADQLGIATGGTLRRTISTSAETPTLPQQGADGSAATPQYGFSADTDNGLYRAGTNNPAIAAGGSQVASFGTTGNTQPLQPVFCAYLASSAANQTGDGTSYTLAGLTEVRDVGSNFNPTTGTFTAPVTGSYLLSAAVGLTDLAADTYEYYEIKIVTTARTYYIGMGNPQNEKSATGGALVGVLQKCGAVVADMSAGDTASVKAIVDSGTKSVDIFGHATLLVSYFTGALIA